MKPRLPAPILRHVAAFWTLMDQPSAKREWSMEQKIREAKRAGFDAMAGRVLPNVAALCRKHGMEYVCYVNGDENYIRELDAVATTKPVRVNVQLGRHDMSPRDGLKIWLGMEAYAAKLGFPLDLETHRTTCTETPEKMEELARLYQKATGRKIRYCYDFSHIAVMKHLWPPFAGRLLDHPDLVQHARQFHFRPFNGHHGQLPATDGKGRETPELKDYLEFLDATLACWFRGAKGGEVVYACPEFGELNSGYGIRSFPSPWKDAVYLRGKIEALWRKHLRRWKKGRVKT